MRKNIRNHNTFCHGAPHRCATQVIGFGVAGLGIALAADVMNCLDNLLCKGLIYIDKRTGDEWKSLRFDIHSNSRASDFLAGIKIGGAFHAALDSEIASVIRAHRKDVICLDKIADFFSVLTRIVAQKISCYESSGFISDTTISCLQLNDDGLIITFNQAGNPVVASNFAIASVGGCEKLLPDIKQLANELRAMLTCSEPVLRNHFDPFLSGIISQQKKIIIVGGGHSAFSIVEYLLRKYGQHLQDGQIIVLIRNKVNVYYESIEDYLCSPRLCTNPKLDAFTNEVNRYCGLRGDARTAYINMMTGNESRVCLKMISEFDVNSYRNNVGICIQATGYCANKIDMLDSRGNTIEMASINEQYALSKTFNFISTDGMQYKQLFGLGLGCFASEAEHFQTTGEIPVGVNIYHAQDALNVVKNLAMLLQEEIAA